MKRVWIVDRQQWPRALLRGELLESGLDVVGFVTVEDALVALVSATASRPDLIVVELKGLGVGDDESLNRLDQTGLQVMLLGGEVELNSDTVRLGEWMAILKRPFTLGQVVQVVRRLLQVTRQAFE
jgi:DNA-binding response OmpR family regulator